MVENLENKETDMVDLRDVYFLTFFRGESFVDWLHDVFKGDVKKIYENVRVVREINKEGEFKFKDIRYMVTRYFASDILERKHKEFEFLKGEIADSNILSYAIN